MPSPVLPFGGITSVQALSGLVSARMSVGTLILDNTQPAQGGELVALNLSTTLPTASSSFHIYPSVITDFPPSPNVPTNLIQIDAPTINATIPEPYSATLSIGGAPGITGGGSLPQGSGALWLQSGGARLDEQGILFTDASDNPPPPPPGEPSAYVFYNATYNTMQVSYSGGTPINFAPDLTVSVADLNRRFRLLVKGLLAVPGFLTSLFAGAPSEQAFALAQS